MTTDRTSQAWHEMVCHVMEEAASSVEAWEYGGADSDAEFRMAREAAVEVAKRIRRMLMRYSRRHEQYKETAPMTRDELDRLADHHGIIRTDSGMVRQLLNQAVRAGLLVRLSYGVYSLPEGG